MDCRPNHSLCALRSSGGKCKKGMERRCVIKTAGTTPKPPQAEGESAGEFCRDDVIKIAKAIISRELHFDFSDSRAYGVTCGFCKRGDKRGYTIDPEDETASDMIDHKLDCPVLIARDILTGN